MSHAPTRRFPFLHRSPSVCLDLRRHSTTNVKGSENPEVLLGHEEGSLTQRRPAETPPHCASSSRLTCRGLPSGPPQTSLRTDWLRRCSLALTRPTPPAPSRFHRFPDASYLHPDTWFPTCRIRNTRRDMSQQAGTRRVTGLREEPAPARL